MHSQAGTPDLEILMTSQARTPGLGSMKSISKVSGQVFSPGEETLGYPASELTVIDQRSTVRLLDLFITGHHHPKENSMNTEAATLLILRMTRNGLDMPPPKCLPPLPEGHRITLSDTCQSHTCEGEQLIELEPILVVDTWVIEPYPEFACWDEENDPLWPRIWTSAEHFSPYWLMGVRVIHDFVPYPPEPFRPVTVLEAACILAQHPRLGSVKAHLDWPGWGHESVQVYRSPKTGTIIASRYGSPTYNHHTAFARYAIHLDAGTMQNCVLREPEKPASAPPQAQSPPPTAAPNQPAAEAPPTSTLDQPTAEVPPTAPPPFDPVTEG